MNSFWSEYPDIQNDLDKVTNIIIKNMKSADKVFRPALLDLAESEGKLLRPAFVLISGRFGNKQTKDLHKIGAAVEMIHMATLIHDDIIDDAKLRRGRPTIHSIYGKKMAVLMGDYVFCRCFLLLSETTSMNNMKRVSKVVAWICTGEMRQLSMQFNTGVNLREYLKRIAAKTAALFAVSFYIGAVQSGCSRELSRILAKIGYNIGVAFQVIDDILDYKSDAESLGKEVGHDLRQGVFTIPLIYALEKDNGELRNMISKEGLSHKEIREVINKVEELGGIEKAREYAEKYTNKAFVHIGSLPAGGGREILEATARKLLKRKY